MNARETALKAPTPFRETWRSDMASGFLVSLIALPLCLGIAMASGFPPIAGITTAILGGLICPFISNSPLTIKGPAAGLIVIALSSVNELGHGDASVGYPLVLGVGVVAGLIQIAFGLIRTGILSEFFPTAAVHGMLAAIGVIITSKQVHTVLGVKPIANSPLALLAEIPHSLLQMNPAIAIIGVTSLLILIGKPWLPIKSLKLVPAPLIVIVFAIVAGMFLNLQAEHTTSLLGHSVALGPKFLIDLPESLTSAIRFPDFSAVWTPMGIKYIVMFSLVGTLESVLSAKAVDLLDPAKRKTDMNKDILAVGLANTCAAMIGGLPMISEIVRSSANINNGAKSRFANAFHGLFLLLFLVALPGLIQRIPLAALAAMLVYTGCRLASPFEFWKTWKIGKEQLLVFCATIIGVLMTDLLVGIAIGVVVELAVYLVSGVPMKAVFNPSLEIEHPDHETCIITAKHPTIFSSWITFKRTIERLSSARTIVVDLTDSHLVDHTVMEKLHQMQNDFHHQDRELIVRGLDDHNSNSDHPLSARLRPLARST